MAVSRATTRPKSRSKRTSAPSLSSRISKLSTGRRDVLTKVLKAYEEVDSQERAADEQASQVGQQVAATVQDAESHSHRALLRDHFLLNTVAYKAAPFELIESLIQRWYPSVGWAKVHRALESVKDAGDGYSVFMDAFRDAAFLAGVSYAHHQEPAWFETFARLDADSQEATRQFVENAWRQQQEWAIRGAAETSTDGRDGIIAASQL